MMLGQPAFFVDAVPIGGEGADLLVEDDYRHLDEPHRTASLPPQYLAGDREELVRTGQSRVVVATIFGAGVA